LLPLFVEHVPLSCIYECIVKDKVARAFLPRLAILDARTQSDILPNAAVYPVSKATPFTSTQNMKGKSLTGKKQ